VSDARPIVRGSLIARSNSALALQIVPCVFLVLWGWGFDDLQAFFLSPARTGLVILALVAVFAVVILGLDVHPLRKGSIPVGNQSLQVGILVLLSLFLLWFLPFADRKKILTFNRDSWRYLGLLLCGIGVSVRVLALKALGKFFSAYVTLQADHRLVRHGIYDCIRHPLYLSLLFIPTGIGFVFDSCLAGPIAILAATFVFDRIRKEDRLLALHFGGEFEDYRRRTSALIPLLF
jgi:protein-S-isoprenylcysteine O-methyltransferase Ste14